MTALGWIQILLYCAIIVAITPVLGAYMTRVFSGERTFLTPILRPVELAIYKVAGIDERHSPDQAVGRTQGHAANPVAAEVLLHLAGQVNLEGPVLGVN